MLNYKMPSLSLMCPVNLSFWWNFGSLLMLLMAFQVMSGFFMTFCFYENFYSNLMCHMEILNGDLVHLTHSSLPGLIFFSLYIHMFKGIYFNSFYKMGLVWNSGFIILVTVMGVAFLGYVLPWGQMSLWGATVITNLLSILPKGTALVMWVWGGFFVSKITAKVFYSLHFLMPFILLILMGGHIFFLHLKGSSNPLGLDLNFTKIEFLPNFSYKDFINVIVLLFFFSFLMQNSFFFLDTENFINANLMVSPLHIKPEWYFLQFYAILRGIPNKLGGVMLFILSLLMLSMFSVLKFYVNLCACKFWKFYSCLFMVLNIMLIWLGSCPVEDPFLLLSQALTFFYFMWFMTLMFMSNKISRS